MIFCWSLLNSEGSPEVSQALQAAQEAKELAIAKKKEEEILRLKQMKEKELEEKKKKKMEKKMSQLALLSPTAGKVSTGGFKRASITASTSTDIKDNKASNSNVELPPIEDVNKWEELLLLLKPHGLHEDESVLTILRTMKLTQRDDVAAAKEIDIRKV